MAYVERLASQRLKGNKWLPVDEVVGLVRRIAAALAYAHGTGVVHRDLKPANIMITPAGAPVVMDFGLARRNDEQGSRITATGEVIGTIAYMPPEQLSGDLERIGPHSDVYSLGCILYESLTGQLPFDGPPATLIMKLLREDPRPIGEVQPHLVDSPLDEVIKKAMAKKVSDRYPTMVEFEAALAIAFGGTPTLGDKPKVGVITMPGDRRADPNTMVRERREEPVAGSFAASPLAAMPASAPKPAKPTPKPPTAMPKPAKPTPKPRTRSCTPRARAAAVRHAAELAESLAEDDGDRKRFWPSSAAWRGSMRARVQDRCRWTTDAKDRVRRSNLRPPVKIARRSRPAASFEAADRACGRADAEPNSAVGPACQEGEDAAADRADPAGTADRPLRRCRRPMPPMPMPMVDPADSEGPSKAELDRWQKPFDVAKDKFVKGKRELNRDERMAALVIARDELTAAHIIAPDDLRRGLTLLERARVNFELTDYKAARIDADQAGTLNPARADEAAVISAQSNRQLWDFPAALAACDRFTSPSHRSVAIAEANRALVHILMEDWEKAAENIDFAMESWAECPMALLANASLAFFRDHDAERASAMLERAVALAPNDPSIRILRAQVRIKLRAFDDAIRDCDEAARRCLWLDPHIVRIQAKLARDRWTYMTPPDPAPGQAPPPPGKKLPSPMEVDIFAVWKLGTPDTPAEWIQTATLYRLRGDFERALVCCNNSLEQQPTAVPGLLARAGVQIDRRDFDGAVADCGKVLELCPENARALYLLGQVALRKNELDDALATYVRSELSEPRFVLPIKGRSDVHIHSQGVREGDRVLRPRPQDRAGPGVALLQPRVRPESAGRHRRRLPRLRQGHRIRLVERLCVQQPRPALVLRQEELRESRAGLHRGDPSQSAQRRAVHQPRRRTSPAGQRRRRRPGRQHRLDPASPDAEEPRRRAAIARRARQGRGTEWRILSSPPVSLLAASGPTSAPNSLRQSLTELSHP